jgi:hypothetical protein
MTTTVHTADFHRAPHAEPLRALRTAWQGYLQRRADRSALARASLRDPRLLADMGIDAEAVREVRSGWDDLRPNGFLVHRRR